MSYIFLFSSLNLSEKYVLIISFSLWKDWLSSYKNNDAKIVEEIKTHLKNEWNKGIEHKGW